MYNKPLFFENEYVTLTIEGSAERYWTYTVKASNSQYDITAPIFEIDGKAQAAILTHVQPSGVPRVLENGSSEYRYEGTFAQDPTLSLELIFRLAANSPVVRFAYVLKSNALHRLTKTSGHDELTYLNLSFATFPVVKEVRFSDFVGLVHSYTLTEMQLEARYFEDEAQVMGPLLFGYNKSESLLIAYEHGSQVPDAFLQFHLLSDHNVQLRASKGNYFHGQIIDAEHSYQTIWLQLAALSGDETMLADTYRSYVLNLQSLHQESRKPYIFYNTWNFQERDRWWNEQGTYLAHMHQERILAEIDVAKRMGVEVFVIDTGWYNKTGDWRVDTKRFPDGLRSVKERLDSYGMKLGLWIGPTSAAISSSAVQNDPSWQMSWQGNVLPPQPIWETEESYEMCLVSPYSDHFAEEMIRLAKEVGVTYFKWDAVKQYGCDAAGHWHGTSENSQEERASSYAFQLIRQMTRIVERICDAIPDAIVDFDVTESGRAVGLGFLSAGKYFLINNGPYYHSYDIFLDERTFFNNLFTHPGPARAWVCRTPLTYDKWLPSVLFLTHYLPDDPRRSQLINIASLILGQNGIWGDLLGISQEGIQLFSDLLARYKVVRDAITQSSPIRTGSVGSSPEIYEKIATANGHGAVVVFAGAAGDYTYVTQQGVAKEYWHTENMQVRLDDQGRAIIKTHFDGEGAQIAFFGVA